MAETKPVILLIPGAWHQGNMYDLVADKLRAANLQVEAATLPSAGGDISATAYDDAKFIQDIYLSPLVAKGKEVIIYTHSYGGVPGTECVKGFARKDLAARGKPGGVVRLIYQSAIILPKGFSTDTFFAWKLGEDGKMYPKEPRHTFYSDLDDSEAAKYVGKLVHHSLEAVRTPLTYEAYRDVPTNYIYCTQDTGFSLVGQKKISGILGEGLVRTYSIDAGHCSMLSQPQAVADAILDIVAGVSAE